MKSKTQTPASVPGLFLNGRVALVTGGASGIGLATARVLSLCGARVVLSDINAQALAQAAAQVPAALTHECDVSNEASVDRMVETVTHEVGEIDILFNSAGIGAPPTSTATQSVPDWQRILDVNLRGTYLPCRAVGARMCQRATGAIINVASVVGTTVLPERTAYGASKSGVIWLTKSLALEWGKAGVRVNVVAPGYVMSPLLRTVAESGAFDLEKLARQTPLGRIADAEEIGHAVAFLASDLAAYVTGAVVPVDGGWTARAG